MRRMRNVKEKFVFFALSLIIGIALSKQLSLNDENNGQSLSDTAAHLQVELANIRERKTKTEKEIVELEEKIRLLKDDQIKYDQRFRDIKSEIDNYELQSGLTKAVGPGIVIDFDVSDSGKFELLMANFDLLLSVINKLNASGAEGIAINEERFVFSTDFRYEQGTLLVNDNPVGRNLQIRAIGDPDTLDATLNMKYGILWEMKNNFNIDSKVQKKEQIELPRYTQEIAFKFAQIEE
ncbi:MAG: DUF881 domain-containing protein [Peptostreptococcaceae bacterium]|nr:DUF881 domain-containing protein [Peptostreptococcaceae bacterium]